MNEEGLGMLAKRVGQGQLALELVQVLMTELGISQERKLELMRLAADRVLEKDQAQRGE